jgi:hypothetical protein
MTPTMRKVWLYALVSLLNRLFADFMIAYDVNNLYSLELSL